MASPAIWDGGQRWEIPMFITLCAGTKCGAAENLISNKKKIQLLPWLPSALLKAFAQSELPPLI